MKIFFIADRSWNDKQRLQSLIRNFTPTDQVLIGTGKHYAATPISTICLDIVPFDLIKQPRSLPYDCTHAHIFSSTQAEQTLPEHFSSWITTLDQLHVQYTIHYSEPDQYTDKQVKEHIQQFYDLVWTNRPRYNSKGDLIRSTHKKSIQDPEYRVRKEEEHKTLHVENLSQIPSTDRLAFYREQYWNKRSTTQ